MSTRYNKLFDKINSKKPRFNMGMRYTWKPATRQVQVINMKNKWIRKVVKNNFKDYRINLSDLIEIPHPHHWLQWCAELYSRWQCDALSRIYNSTYLVRRPEKEPLSAENIIENVKLGNWTNSEKKYKRTVEVQNVSNYLES